MVTGVVPHVGGPVLSVSQATVLIGGRPAARVGDTLTCVGPPDTIMEGEPTVWIGGRPASRIGDATLHNGKIATGDFTVLIGGNNSVTLGRVSVTVATTSKDGKKDTVTLTENDMLAGRPIDNIKPGTNDKVAIIGRKMDGHVKAVAAQLEEMGVKVEIFDARCQTGTFDIDGETLTWNALLSDFKNPTNPNTGLPIYKKDPQSGFIADEDVPKTLIYKANKQWAEKMNTDGSTIINMGYPPPPPLPPSPFYNMEMGVIDF
jgi:uncharacterized Zn-binding protein involved in type VI secretion